MNNYAQFGPPKTGAGTGVGGGDGDAKLRRVEEHFTENENESVRGGEKALGVCVHDHNTFKLISD